MQRFKDLAIGQVFKFYGEDEFPFSGMALGPWRKLSARTYKHEELEQPWTNRVGSINVLVRPIDSSR